MQYLLFIDCFSERLPAGPLTLWSGYSHVSDQLPYEQWQAIKAAWGNRRNSHPPRWLCLKSVEPGVHWDLFTCFRLKTPLAYEIGCGDSLTMRTVHIPAEPNVVHSWTCLLLSFSLNFYPYHQRSSSLSRSSQHYLGELRHINHLANRDFFVSIKHQTWCQ